MLYQVLKNYKPVKPKFMGGHFSAHPCFCNNSSYSRAMTYTTAHFTCSMSPAENVTKKVLISIGVRYT